MINQFINHILNIKKLHKKVTWCELDFINPFYKWIKLQENIINVVLRTSILYLRQELSVMCWTIIKTQMFRGAWGKSNSDISDSFYFSDILIEVCAQKRVTFFTSDRPARFVIMIWFTEWYVAMAWWIWSEAENNTYGKKVAISLESSSFSAS